MRALGTKGYTSGSLLIDGEHECCTLEDEVRPVKIYGHTAIPAGTYKVIITKSNRFKRLMPLLLDVPGFTGVRIHCGNTAEDTSGCILVGQRVDQEEGYLYKSRLAMNALQPKIQAALDAGQEVFLTIRDDE